MNSEICRKVNCNYEKLPIFEDDHHQTNQFNDDSPTRFGAFSSDSSLPSSPVNAVSKSNRKHRKPKIIRKNSHEFDVENPYFDESVCLKNVRRHHGLSFNNNNNEALNGPDGAKKTSFLNILTRTIASMLNKNKTRKTKANNLNDQNARRQLLIDEIYIDDDEKPNRKSKNQIELKLLIPKTCLDKSELEMLRKKRKLHLPNVAKTFSSDHEMKKNRISPSTSKFAANQETILDRDLSDDENMNSIQPPYFNPPNDAHKKNLIICLSIFSIILNPIFGKFSIYLKLKIVEIFKFDPFKPI